MTLRELRQQKKIPMEIVARRAGCGVRQIWLWERWGILPRREVAQRIADALGVHLEQLGYVEPESESAGGEA